MDISALLGILACVVAAGVFTLSVICVTAAAVCVALHIGTASALGRLGLRTPTIRQEGGVSGRPFAVSQEDARKALAIERSLVDPMFGRTEYVDDVSKIPLASTHKVELAGKDHGKLNGFQAAIQKGVALRPGRDQRRAEGKDSAERGQDTPSV